MYSFIFIYCHKSIVNNKRIAKGFIYEYLSIIVIFSYFSSLVEIIIFIFMVEILKCAGENRAKDVITRKRTYFRLFSISFSLFLCLSVCLPLPLPLTHSLWISISLALSFSLSISLCLYLSLSLTHTQTHFLSLSLCFLNFSLSLSPNSFAWYSLFTHYLESYPCLDLSKAKIWTHSPPTPHQPG